MHIELRYSNRPDPKFAGGGGDCIMYEMSPLIPVIPNKLQYLLLSPSEPF